jgi:hypothetical protein
MRSPLAFKRIRFYGCRFGEVVEHLRTDVRHGSLLVTWPPSVGSVSNAEVPGLDDLERETADYQIRGRGSGIQSRSEVGQVAGCECAESKHDTHGREHLKSLRVDGVARR